MGRESGETLLGLSGSYTIEAKHGEGAFGVTYRARVVETGERVIVKELRIEKLRDWKALELFEREGRVLSQISHAHIPAFRDFFAHDGARPLPFAAMASQAGAGPLALFLVQQFVDGPTLQSLVESGARLDAVRADQLLRELLGALAYLHERSPPLIHRDINPRNVILAPAGGAFLVDFGAIQDRLRHAGSVGSTTVGTLGFMALEQIRGDARPASDLYALGVTMTVALTAVDPGGFSVDDATGELRLARMLPPGTPARLQRVLEAMTAPLVGRRVGSAREALSLLDVPPARPHATARAPMLAATGASAILLVVGGATFILARRASAPAPTPPTAANAASPPATLPPPRPLGQPPPPLPLPPPAPSPPTASPVMAAPPERAPVRHATPRWNVRVRHAEGLPLAPGTLCVASATVEATKSNAGVSDFEIHCGKESLYRASDELNGMEMGHNDARERLGRSDDSDTFTLKYSDLGSRTGARSQVDFDSTTQTAVVYRESSPRWRVELAPSLESEPTATLSGAGVRLRRTGHVTEVSGAAGVHSAASCVLRAMPTGYRTECVAEVRCGASVLFPASAGVVCTYGDVGVLGVASTGASPSLSLDADRLEVTTTGAVSSRVAIALDP